MCKYKEFIEQNFRIVDKDGQLVPFILNKIQNRYLTEDYTGKDIILKARQQGFSSLITAIFTADFILREHSYSVVVADIEENAIGLLSKVKKYIESYETTNNIAVPLKYNSKNELYNPFMDTTYKIGTAKNIDFGRSKTLTNLHLSEVAYYPDIEGIIAGAGQAVVETGRLIFETTANGFNDFKKLWDISKQKKTEYMPLFYKASDFYSKEFLEKKRNDPALGARFAQEYPENDTEAFLTSGNCYFDKEALKVYIEHAKTPITDGVIYV
jgi:hypothetical protein